MFKIPSFTTHNKYYMVRYIDGVWLCGCPDYLTRGKQKKTCKHIEKAKEQLISDTKRDDNFSNGN